MNLKAPAILDHLSALADTTRSRILLLLDRHELTVTELCNVMQLPQSTISRHLKALSDAGWVTSRAEGASPEAIRRLASAADRPVDEIVKVADTVLVRPDPAPVAA